MDNATTSLGATVPANMLTSSTLTAGNKGEQQKTQFLKLLVAQLKGQNPLDPKDGAEFVTQLAQFSSLEELINIRTTLESLAKQSSSGTSTTQSSNLF